MNLHFLYEKFYKEFFSKYPAAVFVTDEFSVGPPYYLIKRISKDEKSSSPGMTGYVLFFDQEPIYPHTSPYKSNGHTETKEWFDDVSLQLLPKLVIISEHSSEAEDLKDKLTELNNGAYQPVVYYFYHAIACLDNYRNYWKEDIQIPSNHKYLFICYQNVINPYRWHRIRFQHLLRKSGLGEHGLVSYFPPEKDEVIRIIKDATKRHGNEKVEQEVLNDIDLLLKSSSIDTDSPDGAMSTFIDIENCHKAFIHVVSETAFYNGKKHLTEKIFKPIVAKQPFLLLGAYGNLEYLKSYGFKTFDRWWDESYDNIKDDDERIKAVFNILERISKMSYEEQCAMHKEMHEVLEYNWYHFYYNLKDIVIDELVANMKEEFAKSPRWAYMYTNDDIDHLGKMLRF